MPKTSRGGGYLQIAAKGHESLTPPKLCVKYVQAGTELCQAQSKLIQIERIVRKKIEVGKKVWLEKYFGSKEMFGSKKFLGQKNFWVKKILESKNFMDK